MRIMTCSRNNIFQNTTQFSEYIFIMKNIKLADWKTETSILP